MFKRKPPTKSEVRGIHGNVGRTINSVSNLQHQMNRQAAEKRQEDLRDRHDAALAAKRRGDANG